MFPPVESISLDSYSSEASSLKLEDGVSNDGDGLSRW